MHLMCKNDRVMCRTCKFYGLDSLPDGEYSPCDDCENCSNWIGEGN